MINIQILAKALYMKHAYYYFKIKKISMLSQTQFSFNYLFITIDKCDVILISEDWYWEVKCNKQFIQYYMVLSSTKSTTSLEHIIPIEPELSVFISMLLPHDKRA